MRLAFFGSTSLGLHCLDLARSLPDFEVVGCLTAPSTVTFSRQREPMTNIMHGDFLRYCTVNNIECRLLDSSGHSDELLRWHQSLEADLTLVIGWHHIIPTRWVESHNFYGVHGSLLPDLAGGAPLVWAIILGRQRTGVTLFAMDAGVDTGPIVGQESFSLSDEPYISDALARLQLSTEQLLLRELPRIRNGTHQLRAQSGPSRVVMPQRTPSDGLILTSQPTRTTLRFIKAQSRPYPGAFCDTGDRHLRVWQAEIATELPSSPRSLLPNAQLLEDTGGRIYLQCTDGFLELTDYRWECAG